MITHLPCFLTLGNLYKLKILAKRKTRAVNYATVNEVNVPVAISESFSKKNAGEVNALPE
jgi:hypothetical protein